MMQVTGKTNSAKNKGLSIQLFLGGLSFYNSITDELITHKIDTSVKLFNKDIISLIDRYIYLNDYKFDIVNIVVATDRYAVVPTDFFNDSYSRKILSQNGVKYDANDIIIASETGNMIFLMPIPEEVVSFMESKFKNLVFSHPLLLNLNFISGEEDFNIVINKIGSLLSLTAADSTRGLLFNESYNTDNATDDIYILGNVGNTLNIDKCKIIEYRTNLNKYTTNSILFSCDIEHLSNKSFFNI